MSKKKKRSAVLPPKVKSEAVVEAKSTAVAGFSFFDSAWLPLLVLLAATTAVYFGSLDNGFVGFDDDKAV